MTAAPPLGSGRVAAIAALLAAGMLLSGCAVTRDLPQAGRRLDASAMPKVAEVDRRFQSYNIEMVQVTGGRFWAPYRDAAGQTYRYRPPVDLANPRIRALAAHLGPAYVRVSGTWANTTYVPAPGEEVTQPPEGFGQVLQPGQWRGVIDFARAADAALITSFAGSAGTRDSTGRWTSAQADRLMALTRAAGGTIDAAEFINEPSLIGPGGLPRDYDSAAFARDFDSFMRWKATAAPQMMVLGPGNLGEATVDPAIAARLMAPGGVMGTERLVRATAAHLDGISWHFYGGVSPRCGGGTGVASREAALSDEWLDRTMIDYRAMADVRDRLAPGKPLWLTETAQAACGGSPWAAQARDMFRYTNQLGALARQGVRVVIHNTLFASDYGLIDEDTLAPRPNYWAAILWHRVMGQTVLDAGTGPSGLRLFAHCLPGTRGGVGLVAINAGGADQILPLAQSGDYWLVAAADLDSASITVNGQQPTVGDDGTLGGLSGRPFRRLLSVPARTIAFAAVPRANNPSCTGAAGQN